jgi:hypothetical protein
VNGFGGIGHIIELIEARFGRPWANIILLVVTLAVIGFCWWVVQRTLVAPLFSLIGGVLEGRALITLDNLAPVLLTTMALAVIALLGVSLIVILGTVRRKRVPQEAIDSLAELRSEAIHELLNRAVKNDAELVKWKTDQDSWCQRVLDVLKRNSTHADYLSFSRLGLIKPFKFPYAYNEDHNRELTHFAKRLTILEDLIRRYST